MPLQLTVHHYKDESNQQIAGRTQIDHVTDLAQLHRSPHPGKPPCNYSRAFIRPSPSGVTSPTASLLVALPRIGTLFSSTFVAYAFARLHWPGRDAFCSYIFWRR